ncbi:lactonase family protein [Cohnella fermenti]|uniref:Lactonase family protein n=1 Tax=Cohnella fermenti TaxID=2565925 RepID=A0A4S4CB72_9BACL|nr:lactonase family protein [Cohnella fermenti]THF84728.1 lactonase family protein [Cohnella fermenti]
MNDRMLVLVGSYAEEDGNGIYSYSFNEENGTLEPLSGLSGFKNPTFLQLDAANKRLYAIAEIQSDDGGKASDAVRIAIDPSTGALTEEDRSLASTGPACHIQISPGNRYLTLTSYHQGTVSLTALEEDGRISKLLDERQHVGQGGNPERQDRPHTHSSFHSPDGRYLFVCELGIDRIIAYTIEGDALKLRGETALHPGAGPRHLAFHPNGRFAYVINEVDSTVTALGYDAEAGALHPFQTLSTLPDGFEGENTTAEIALSADGRFLYGSNRGHDSLAVYSVDEESGKLSFLEHVGAQGKHPRHFSIVPGGRYLIAANRDTNNLAVFKLDPESGLPSFTGHSVTVSKPVCVWAARF